MLFRSTNVCVDRATLGLTIIRRGTKIDNLVQIAHNDVLGEHVIMSGQAGLAGSVTVGDRVMFGGQAGVADHLKIGDDARIFAKAGVIKHIKPGESVWGYPARPTDRIKRELANLAHLPRFLQAFKEWLRRVEAIESRLTRLEQHRPQSSSARARKRTGRA